MDDTREAASETFRDLMRPLLALADKHPSASEVFIDGEEIRLSFGDHRVRYDFADLDGLRPRHIEAAGQAAAVFAGLEFGPMPPALPMISVKIPPDLRVTYTCPPAAERWHVAIRFLRTRRLTLEDYIAKGIMSADQADQVRLLLRPPSGQSRKNVIVSGGTGTGKTTLLRAMLGEIAHERLVVLEDTPELAIPGDNVIHYCTTLNVDLAMLLRHTLRSTPDRIVVGEVRGPEALELVRAMNTGHNGTLATIHSNGAEEVIYRLLTNVREAQPSFPEQGIRTAVDAVVQLTGQGQQRRVSDIWHVKRQTCQLNQRFL